MDGSPYAEDWEIPGCAAIPGRKVRKAGGYGLVHSVSRLMMPSPCLARDCRALLRTRSEAADVGQRADDVPDPCGVHVPCQVGVLSSCGVVLEPFASLTTVRGSVAA